MERTARRFMRRRTAPGMTGLLLVLLAMSWLLTGCGKPSDFEGSRTSNATGFWMEYAILDREETADLSMEEGEELQVSIMHTAGEADITVGRVGEEPIYKGAGLTDADFVLIISEKGTYRISVTGHRAKGSVFFTRVAGHGQ